ncbi:MAG TPA: PP2C family protein-serine/threonine phosphatase [Cerasibacillus sp.]|uniref:PP2C family protein-serine/threonine phosphatase n=1 Tax=Cerasibacillus sp. TaxID=2498711 RepID=UPI002F419386
MDTILLDKKTYKQLLKQYILTQDESALYRAGRLTRNFIKKNILPEEIIDLHVQELRETYPAIYGEVLYMCQFLLETMISYGLAIQESETLREKQLAMRTEISLAANIQKILLATSLPKVNDLDIGVISVPAKQMNGDYYHFIAGKDGSIGIALADIIGKGIPAALCMSMIKYAMDSFPEQLMNPNDILRQLNHVVELNVDSSMFITMIYAKYRDNILTYASAGHEPGIYYCKKKETFHELRAKGLVLGVSADVNYLQYERELKKGDMVILLTDGVTEYRQGDQFAKRDELLRVIKNSIHLKAQQIVENVYQHFRKLSDYYQEDDFTLIILRKL